MTDRWRGRRAAGLAAVVLAATALSGAVAARPDAGQRWVVVRDEAGVELARAVLPASGEFSLRYRNSLYHSIAEERFRADGDHLDLVGLAAEELAVLEEYYTATGAARTPPGTGLGWQIAVQRPPVPLPLRVQASALGQRILVTSGDIIGLWQLVAGRDTTVVLTIEAG